MRADFVGSRLMQVLAQDGQLHVALARGPPSTLRELRLDADYVQLDVSHCLHNAPDSMTPCCV